MLTVNRYLLKHLINPVLFISLSLTCIIWLAQSLRFIDLIVNRGLSVSLFLYLTTLLMPSLLAIVLPIALFCAILFTYNKLYSESELVVMEGAGFSKWQLARPALQLAAILMAFGYLISLWLLPASYREFKDLQFFIRNNYASLLLQEGVFSTPTRGLTVYIRKREGNDVLRGIMVHDNRDATKPVTMMAEEGYLVNTPSGPRFILEHGNRQEVDQESDQLSLLLFDRYTLNLNLFIEQSEQRWREAEERYLPELFNPEEGTPPHMVSRLRAEGHQRLIWPLYNVALAMVGLAGMLSGGFNRRGRAKRIIATSAAAGGIVSAALALNNAMAQHLSLVPVAYLVAITVIGGAVWVLWREHLSHGISSPTRKSPMHGGAV